MRATHLEFLVEEPSMEILLREILPGMIAADVSFAIHAYQGKTDLLRKLSKRLRGYRDWLPPTARIVVVLDRDDEDCIRLKQVMEENSRAAGLRTRRSAAPADWQVATRIAIEEMEAWFFGDWPAVRRAYPRASSRVPGKASYRDPDAITGGTWEALERVLQSAGYFPLGLRKLELARSIGHFMEPARNRSASFQALRRAIEEATAH
jgi:hypothetical protein